MTPYDKFMDSLNLFKQNEVPVEEGSIACFNGIRHIYLNMEWKESPIK